MVRQAIEVGEQRAGSAARPRAARPPRARRGGRSARARCSAATAAEPLGRMKLVSGSSVAFIASISSSSRSTWLGDDAQRAFDLAGRGDVGAEVEQLVLDAHAAGQRGLAAGQRGDGHADRGIGLVDLADRGHAQARLADPAAVDQPGAAAVAGARVDLVELDQAAGLPAGLPATTRIRIDDDDRDALEQHALAHLVLLLLAGHVLARGHGDHAANEDVSGRGHGERGAG